MIALDAHLTAARPAVGVVAALDATGHACTLVSEETVEIRHSAACCRGDGFVVCFDPVDGSSNLDVNGIVGTAGAYVRTHANLRIPARWA